MGVRALGPVFVIFVVAAACTDVGSAATPREGSLGRALTASANEAAVPRDLLVAIAQVEGGLDVPQQRDRATLDLDAAVPAAGPLQLRRGKLDTLQRGAELAGVSEIELRANADLALRAGALVLAELGTKEGAHGDLASWKRAIEEMSGFADAAHREHYAHQVFATLARGGTFPARDGEVVVLPAHDLPPSLTIDVSEKVRMLAVAEYPGAEWIPTSCSNGKCATTRSGNHVEYVVIHDTEGNWTASVATLQNDPGKSVQYIVGTDGHVAQFVTEETTAYHAGNLSYNERSVGIEHVGYDKQPFTEPQYAASAKLVDYLATKYAVPRDRAHIIGHDQVPNGTKIAATSPPCSDSPTQCEASDDYGGANNHRDPGIWEWATYMPRFDGQAKCDDVTDLWACSYDKTKRLRCAGGSVDVEACSGSCSSSAPDTPDASAGGEVCVDTPPPPLPTPAGDGAAPAADSGCAIGPSRPSSSSGTAAAVLALLATLRVRAGRRREDRT
jgi:N-acetyl-anhydromuramyl-L-alanine amidase AmpD